jgi:integrase
MAYADIEQIARDAGITEPMGCHTLRKTFGYHFYRATKDIALLMAWFNHSSAVITLRYIGADLDDRRRAVDRFRYRVVE